MTDSDKSADQIEEEIRWYQDNSARLAQEDAPEGANWTNAPGTTPISIRMKHADVERLTQVANDKGVSISHLVRNWILERLYADDSKGVYEALEDLEQSYVTLRRAINACH